VGKENSHGVIHSRHKQQFSINASAGIVGDCLVGSHVLPHLAYWQTFTKISSYIICHYWRVWHLSAVMFPEDGPHPTWYLRRKQSNFSPLTKLVQALTLLTCLRKVPASNTGRDPDYPDLGFSWFSVILQDKRRDSASNSYFKFARR
jgi:hypothetical protein